MPASIVYNARRCASTTRSELAALAPAMPKNIEIKARYENLDRARNLALGLGAKSLGVDHQIDTYFRVPSGRLKIRVSSLSGCYLVPYSREDLSGPRASEYLMIPIAESQVALDLFSKILGVNVCIDKQREILLFENVRIHLDRVAGVGDFIELEAVCRNNADLEDEYTKISLLMKLLEIDQAKLETGSYQELIANAAEEKPLESGDLWSDPRVSSILSSGQPEDFS